MKARESRQWYRRDACFFSRPDIERLNNEAVIAFMLLQDRQWTHGVLPDDEEALRRIVGGRVTDFGATWARIRPMLKPVDGGLSIPEIEEERANADRVRALRVAGGLATQFKADERDKPRDKPRDQQTITHGFSSAESESDTQSQKKKEIETEKTLPPTPSGGGKVRKRLESSLSSILPGHPSLDCPEFTGAWARWFAHRAEIRKPLTPTQEAGSVAACAKMGLPRALAAIDHTIAKGWQGLAEPEPSKNGREVRRPDGTRQGEFPEPDLGMPRVAG